MKIKAKLTLGVGVLFGLIMLQALVGAWKVNELAGASKNILTNNYNSLDFSNAMLASLDYQSLDRATGFSTFEYNLKQQENNITEAGESEATTLLREAFNRFRTHTGDTLALNGIRKAINTIVQLNLSAIERKSISTENTAEQTIFILSAIGTICFLIAFTLLFNLPDTIAGPVRSLNDSIKQIADGNYEQRIHLSSSESEFNELARSFNTMAAKLQEFNSSNLARLMVEKQRIETLINNLHDPVIGLDEFQRIIFINSEALNVSGLKKENALGKTVAELAAGNDLIQSLALDLTNQSKKTDPEPARPIRIFADGKESYFDKELLQITAATPEDPAGRNLGNVIWLRNITSYKELDLAKTNFIATVSHEFKTPITSIKMSLQLLEDERVAGQLNQEQKALVSSIHEDAERLLRITRELLNMAQVETGNIQLSIQPANPRTILQNALEVTQPQADLKRIRLVLDAPESVPFVLADPDKTVWVLCNLIVNAIHYSYENAEIRLTIRENNGWVELAVRDTGQGIAPQYQDKVFNRYFRVPGSRHEGTGLGLAISKEFLEAQGGSIQMQSEYGAGSTFTVRLKRVDTA